MIAAVAQGESVQPEHGFLRVILYDPRKFGEEHLSLLNHKSWICLVVDHRRVFGHVGHSLGGALLQVGHRRTSHWGGWSLVRLLHAVAGSVHGPGAVEGAGKARRRGRECALGFEESALEADDVLAEGEVLGLAIA